MLPELPKQSSKGEARTAWSNFCHSFEGCPDVSAWEEEVHGRGGILGSGGSSNEEEEQWDM